MKIKVCGMGSNLEAVATLQPDYLGFIFWQPSSRYFEGTIQRHINLPKIGVFVDSDLKNVLDHVRTHGLDGVQLHGDESEAYCAKLRGELLDMGKSIQLIKAFKIAPGFSFENIEGYEGYTDYFLFDAKGELPGGNSVRFNWELLHNYDGQTPYLLSGGIGPEDVGRIRSFLKEPVSARCHAIDVNSKFELSPGNKDIERLKPFLAEIRNIKTQSK